MLTPINLYGCKEGRLFSMLYNKVERQEWLDCAIQGGVLKEFGHDGGYNCIFTGSEGNPQWSLTIFFIHVCRNRFWTIELGDRQRRVRRDCERTENILSKRDNPKGKWNKAFPGTRNLKSFSFSDLEQCHPGD